jgi:hypothetical protein
MQVHDVSVGSASMSAGTSIEMTIRKVAEEKKEEEEEGGEEDGGTGSGNNGDKVARRKGSRPEVALLNDTVLGSRKRSPVRFNNDGNNDGQAGSPGSTGSARSAPSSPVAGSRQRLAVLQGEAKWPWTPKKTRGGRKGRDREQEGDCKYALVLF